MTGGGPRIVRMPPAGAGNGERHDGFHLHEGEGIESDAVVTTRESVSRLRE